MTNNPSISSKARVTSIRYDKLISSRKPKAVCLVDPTAKNQALIKQYEQSRRIGEQFSNKIPETYGMEEYLPKILRVFGISQGKKIALESDEELNFIMDFLSP